MPYTRRLIQPLVLVSLVLALAFPVLPLTLAQDDATTQITIQGDARLENLVAAIRDAYLGVNPDADILVDAGVGVNVGFQNLCNADDPTDMVMSLEPITDAQMTVCNNNGVNFIETVIAYDAIVLLATPEAQITCLNMDLVAGAWQLGGAPTTDDQPGEAAATAEPNADLTWADLGSTTITTPITFYGPDPAANRRAYDLFADLLPGGALRENIVTEAANPAPEATAEPAATEEPAATAEPVAPTALAGGDIVRVVTTEGSSAFGFMSLADWDKVNPGDGSVMPLQISDAQYNCYDPSQATIESNTYPLSRTAYLYINANSAQDPAVLSFVQFALSDPAGAQAVAAEQNYSLGTEATYARGLNNILDGRTGRTFTRPLTPVQVSPIEPDTLTVVGSPMLDEMTTSITTEFNNRTPEAMINTTLLGNADGRTKFCAGEADVFQSTLPLGANEALCETLNAYPVDLGYDALVMAVPEASPIECLTGDEFGTLMAAGDDMPTTWNQINSAFPETPIQLILPPMTTGETDYIVFGMTGQIGFNVRADSVVVNTGEPLDDPAYRLQAVANGESGFTYVRWSDLQNNPVERIKLVQVNKSGECAAPSLETFQSGAYSLAYPIRYYFSETAFQRPLVRALLWHFFDTTTTDLLRSKGFAGLDVDLMAGTMRDDVYNMLAAIEAAQQTAEPAATEEPAVEPTAEATAEPTAEATVDPTAEATAAPTE